MDIFSKKERAEFDAWYAPHEKEIQQYGARQMEVRKFEVLPIAFSQQIQRQQAQTNRADEFDTWRHDREKEFRQGERQRNRDFVEGLNSRYEGISYSSGGSYSNGGGGREYTSGEAAVVFWGTVLSGACRVASRSIRRHTRQHRAFNY